jgi:hypothetical protein
MHHEERCITKNGIGVGYSYALSSQIVRDSRANAPGKVRVFFYVDNWDPTQDDLRRFMELDTESAKAASDGEPISFLASITAAAASRRQ